MDNLLEVKNLEVSFYTHAGEVQAVRGVNFTIKQGEVVAIVGESGCGKSVTAKSIMKLLPSSNSSYKKGSILFKGQDIIQNNEREMKRIRGNEIGMIFQDPMTSLNPTSKISDQIAEGLRKHRNMSRKEAVNYGIKLLEMVGIPHAGERIHHYPHEFSGGMRQRVMIAIAIACEPELLIADEPTTALDVTIQAQILKLLNQLKDELNTAIVLITHDLGVVAELCDKVIVMYAGKVVETGTVAEIFRNPRHPYTMGLMRSIPRIDMHRDENLYSIVGTPPDLLDPPKGCAFYPRCKYAMKICKDFSPETENLEQSQEAACWLYHPLAKSAVKTS
ncbi:ABC transporter ATP-binding protein [Neobacillus niacini]|uniref:ABC transporter ATP-binding protein n=1 Tax=Neobacillus niacini TaxID=86668 RepID=UPI0039837901